MSAGIDHQSLLDLVCTRVVCWHWWKKGVTLCHAALCRLVLGAALGRRAGGNPGEGLRRSATALGRCDIDARGARVRVNVSQP